MKKKTQNSAEAQRKALYESIMKDVAKVINARMNEDQFVAPEKTFKEKLFGGAAAYEKRVKEAEKKYYEGHRKKYVDALARATTMAHLLQISKAMMNDGFKFPVSGMIFNGTKPANSTLDDIKWMTYDRESSLSAQELSTIEKKQPVNDLYVYTYYYSWRWWVAGILRCLFYWQDPYSSEADNAVSGLMKTYGPKCPIIALYPDYFKQQ